jgi:MarR family 2-MHQ and catechol resistance regulon transcriptional repressor
MPEDARELYYRERLQRFSAEYRGSDMPSSQIIFDLLYTYDVLHQVTARYMADFGLSKASFNVLMILRYGPPEGMQLHALGDLLLVTRANITGVIDSLEAKGYVTRVVDETDRRARYARITKQAQDLLNEFLPLHSRNIATLFQDLKTEEKQQLSGLLKKTRNSFKTHAEDCLRAESPSRRHVAH